MCISDSRRSDDQFANRNDHQKQAHSQHEKPCQHQAGQESDQRHKEAENNNQHAYPDRDRDGKQNDTGQNKEDQLSKAPLSLLLLFLSLRPVLRSSLPVSCLLPTVLWSSLPISSLLPAALRSSLPVSCLLPATLWPSLPISDVYKRQDSLRISCMTVRPI